MAARKRPVKRKTPVARRRKTAVRRKPSGKLVNFAVPFIFVISILFCLGFLTHMGYQTVTASAFFDVKQIDVRGTNRSPKEAIENIVKRESEKTGVWNADLTEIKSALEDITYVKTASVSRILPNGVRVDVLERTPRVVVELKDGVHWVDEEAVFLGKVAREEQTPPFVLRGWSRSRLDKAKADNQLRVKMYLQMLEEWQDFEVAKRVVAVDLSEVDDAKAIVRDSGKDVSVSLGSKDFGKRLRNALKEIAGKGKNISAVISDGQKLVAFPRES